MAEHFIVKGGSEYQIIGGELSLQDGQAIDAGTIEVAVTAQPFLSSGDEVSIIQRPTDGSGDSQIFAGRISRPLDAQGLLKMDVESYSGILNRVHASEIYNNQSPEYIVQDLITKYSDLTYASTATTGITITQFIVNDETIYSAIKRLLDLLGSWQLRGDFSKNIYFEPKSINNSGKTLTVGTNCYTLGDWDRNPDNISNMLILVGSNQTFTTQVDSFTATAGQTTKALSYIPTTNFRITDNGTELKGGLSSSVSNPDYVVDPNNLLITFSTGRTVGHTIVVSYSYEIPIKITARGPEDSIAKYGEHEDKITNNTIMTMEDGRKFVESYFSERAYPTISNTIGVADDYAVTQGQTITVVDDFSNVNLLLQVQAKKYDFTNGMTILTVGSRPFTNYNLQKDIKARLKALEDSKDNSNKIQRYNSVEEVLDVSIINNSYNYELPVYDSWVWGVSQWNVNKWGDRREGDNFDQGGTYAITNRWTVSGSVTLNLGRMKLDASSTTQTAIYTAGSSYSIISGKIILHVQKSAASGSLTLLFRYVDSSNYYSVVFDFSGGNVLLKKTVGGSTSTLQSVSQTFATDGDLFVVRYSGSNFTIQTASANIITQSDSSITATGNIRFSCTGTIAYVQDIRIFNEV